MVRGESCMLQLFPKDALSHGSCLLSHATYSPDQKVGLFALSPPTRHFQNNLYPLRIKIKSYCLEVPGFCCIIHSNVSLTPIAWSLSSLGALAPQKAAFSISVFRSRDLFDAMSFCYIPDLLKFLQLNH